MKRNEFFIPFSGLALGKHKFVYEIDNTFFADFDYQEFNEASIQAKVILNKIDPTMQLHLEAQGTVNVNCDATNEPFDQPICASLDLAIKFGEAYNDDHDEILILPHGAYQVNVVQYLYEMLVLAVPQKRRHPGLLDGTLKSEILEKLDELHPKESKEPLENTTDPRWDDLKKLLTDK